MPEYLISSTILFLFDKNWQTDEGICKEVKNLLPNREWVRMLFTDLFKGKLALFTHKLMVASLLPFISIFCINIKYFIYCLNACFGGNKVSSLSLTLPRWWPSSILRDIKPFMILPLLKPFLLGSVIYSGRRNEEEDAKYGTMGRMKSISEFPHLWRFQTRISAR